MNFLKKYTPIFIIIILSIIAWSFNIHKYFTFDAIRENQKFINSFIESNYIYAYGIFSISYILIVSLSIPGATFMTLAGGLLFGQIVGTIINVVAATIGATILFLSARMASGNVLEKAGPWLKKMHNGFKENAFSYLLTLRLVPLFPFVAVNLVSAIANVNIKTFFFATIIGIIPGTFVYTSIGVALQSVISNKNISVNLILEPSIIISLVGLGVMSLVPVFYKKWKKNKDICR
jgi:uncharacterized membrane protein YdjX (TVP38/TMEM64 family)